MDKNKQGDRTEDDIVALSPIKVILGGKERDIAPLVIRDSKDWRKKVGPWKASLATLASVDSDKPEEFKKALTVLMVDRIDQTIDYFFQYARDLKKEDIEATATDKEIVAAFNEVFKVAFPFG